MRRAWLGKISSTPHKQKATNRHLRDCIQKATWSWEKKTNWIKQAIWYNLNSWRTERDATVNQCKVRKAHDCHGLPIKDIWGYRGQALERITGIRNWRHPSMWRHVPLLFDCHVTDSQVPYVQCCSCLLDCPKAGPMDSESTSQAWGCLVTCSLNDWLVPSISVFFSNSSCYINSAAHYWVQNSRWKRSRDPVIDSIPLGSELLFGSSWQLSILEPLAEHVQDNQLGGKVTDRLTWTGLILEVQIFTDEPGEDQKPQFLLSVSWTAQTINLQASGNLISSRFTQR